MNNYNHKEAVAFLNAQIWHDSVLYEIRIIRTNSLDQIIILLNLITDEDKWESQNTTLVFNDCYHIETKMHGGVLAMSDGEMISHADANLDGSFIDQVNDTWEKMKIELPELFHFSMVLASTGSEVDIVCKSVSVLLEGDSRTHSAPPAILPI